ncbi:division/cell wall cluster transcriptional repressor MraZ [Hyphomicrobiales bacterium]|nr:division/cell wall cluster transcriptional repressor MraZ [Hyphomicrobiales bacterium]MDA8892716.1 division/cell wall cluster transcriptional repressor MraZ [Hyphomicrobiales bacterium]MDA9035052.1 division/cell wall cluster transcriptional repressor MraZ [Hyphomicrobiales bacterium]MDA9904702.1 division/cell wall cluster transcriptional repressor MraZ [Hyphomicrobiales bacterium]
MKIFMSSAINKIDSKGRISIPAPFRSVLEFQGYPGVYLFPSFTSKAVDGGGQDLIDQISLSVEKMQLFAEETDALSTALFADTYSLSYDQDGRISLPEILIEHANLSEKVIFVGQGRKFQMWNPDDFNEFKREAKIKALENRNLIGPSPVGKENKKVDD